MSAIDTIERALELAADGSHKSLTDIRKTLHREQFDGVDQHLAGSSIKAQIAKLIERAKS